MSNDLITSDSAKLLDQINEAESVEQVLTMLKQLKVLKSALDAMNRFREKSVLFARLEAEALVRVIELGGISELRGYKRKTAEWLSSMSAEERAEKINRCTEGMTIDVVYRMEHPEDRRPTVQEKKMALVDAHYETLLESIEKGEPVDLTEYASAVRNATQGTANMVESVTGDAVDSMRHHLREKGYVGIGNKTGKYFPASPEHKEDVAKAVTLRVRSIIQDIYSLRYILRKSEIGKLSVWDFEYDDSWHMSREKEIVYPLMLFLYRIDLFDDIEAYESVRGIKWDTTNLKRSY